MKNGGMKKKENDYNQMTRYQKGWMEIISKNPRPQMMELGIYVINQKNCKEVQYTLEK